MTKLDAIFGISDSLTSVVKINANVYVSDSLIKISRMLDEDKVVDENIVSFYVDDKLKKVIVIVRK